MQSKGKGISMYLEVKYVPYCNACLSKSKERKSCWTTDLFCSYLNLLLMLTQLFHVQIFLWHHWCSFPALNRYTDAESCGEELCICSLTVWAQQQRRVDDCSFVLSACWTTESVVEFPWRSEMHDHCYLIHFLALTASQGQKEQRRREWFSWHFHGAYRSSPHPCTYRSSLNAYRLSANYLIP